MKAIYVLTLMLIGASANAAVHPNIPPDSIYAGSGECSEHGTKIPYTGRAEFSGGHYISTFSHDNQTMSFELEFKLTGADKFDVLIEGKKVGEGWCNNGVLHYNAEVHSEEINETLEFKNGSLHRTGLSTCSQGVMTWEDNLELQSGDQIQFGNHMSSLF